jgi:HEAT repeats
VLTDYLDATRTDDVRTMQSVFAGDEHEQRVQAILAVGDYLAAETDLEREEEVLDLWAAETRNALIDRDVSRTRALLDPVRQALLDTSDDRRSLFEAFVRWTLDRQLVSQLVAGDAAEGSLVVPELLAPFGEVGVDVLLDLLAEEDDRNRRAQFLGVLRRTVGGNLGPVTRRLSDPRWYVVRNAVSLLGSVGGTQALPRIEKLASHGSAAVRREVAPALVAAGGPAAVPSLGRLTQVDDAEVRRQAVNALGSLVSHEAGEALAQVVRSSGDPALRARALEELAQRPDGIERLRELASRRGRPRLPWAMRRRARSLARHAGGIR